MEIFEWKRFLMNDLPWEFLLEVVTRSAIMFILLLFTLKLTGKRGVRQLSVFETVIIIALGSAAGDPMFYENVGIIPAVVVFLVIILLYRFVTLLTGKSKRFEEFMEGKTECLISNGTFDLASFGKESLAQDEFFSELRMQSVEHLGQVKMAYLETNGQVSIYYFEDTEVKYGLPIIPHLFCDKSKIIVSDGIYSCTFCGNTEHQKPGTAVCKVCKKEEWVEAINSKRIT